MTRRNTTPDIDTERDTAEARAELLRLSEQQGTRLATTFEELLGDGGASDETADDIIRAVREWRDQPTHRSID